MLKNNRNDSTSLELKQVNPVLARGFSGEQAPEACKELIGVEKNLI
jgi:hypothetical protein